MQEEDITNKGRAVIGNVLKKIRGDTNGTDRIGFDTTWQGRRRRVCVTVSEQDWKTAKAKGISMSFALGVGLRRLANSQASSQEAEFRELQEKVRKLGERLSNTSQRLYDAEARLNRLS